MLLHNVLSQVTKIGQSIFNTSERHFKAWTEPVSDSMVRGVATDLVKSKQQIILENTFLRQQVIVSKLQVARPQLTTEDRSLLVLLASRVRDWKNALLW